MADVLQYGQQRKQTLAAGLRLIRVVIFEAVFVAIIGFLVWGVAWDLGYPKAGLILAIVIWLTVSPVIEIATVMNFRKATSDEEA